jgi:hypothetical protein
MRHMSVSFGWCLSLFLPSAVVNQNVYCCVECVHTRDNRKRRSMCAIEKEDDELHHRLRPSFPSFFSIHVCLSNRMMIQLSLYFIYICRQGRNESFHSTIFSSFSIHKANISKYLYRCLSW